MKVQAVCACRPTPGRYGAFTPQAWSVLNPAYERSTPMTLPIPEPLEIPDPNIDDPALPSSVPVDDPDPTPPPPGTDPTIGDPPDQSPPERA